MVLICFLKASLRRRREEKKMKLWNVAYVSHARGRCEWAKKEVEFSE